MDDAGVRAVGNALCLLVAELKQSGVTDFERFGRLLALVGTVAHEDGDPDQGRMLCAWAVMMEGVASRDNSPEGRPN